MVLQNLDRTSWTFAQALAHVEAVVTAHRTAEEKTSPSPEPTSHLPAWRREDPASRWKSEAYEQLMTALRDGDLHARGRYSETRINRWGSTGREFGMHSGYHTPVSPAHWLEGEYRNHALTSMDWEFIDIKMPRFMVLAIWPPYEEPAAERSAEASAYTTPYLELMQRAIVEFGLNEANQEKKELLVDWFSRQQIDGEPLSNNLADAMATLVRLPASQRGGARRPLGPEFARTS